MHGVAYTLIHTLIIAMFLGVITQTSRITVIGKSPQMQLRILASCMIQPLSSTVSFTIIKVCLASFPGLCPFHMTYMSISLATFMCSVGEREC